MYWAVERRAGKTVHADQAKAWGDYRCPTCKAEVFLRAGRYRANHFAHMPGQGKPDCENYHYFGGLAHTSSTIAAPSQPKHVEPLSLGIELEPQQQLRNLRRWRLRLTIPRAPDAHGQISICLSDTDTRKISLTKLSMGAETYNVALDSIDFGASWVSPEVRPEYREAVRHRVLGLDPKKGNAFAAARSKLKPRTYSLLWGGSYYLVWRTDRKITVPGTLTWKLLARVEQWDCALFSLPHDPDDEIEAWVRDWCDLTVARSTRDWAIVYPAPYAIGDDGGLQIPANDQIIVALRSEDDESAGDLVCSNGQSHALIELDGVRQQLVFIHSDDPAADTSIYIGWDSAHVATLETRPYPANSAEIAVTLVFDGPQGKVRAGLHTADGQALLSEVRLHRRSIASIHGHPALRGLLRFRPANLHDWQELALHFSPRTGVSNGAIGDDLLRQLCFALLDDTLHFQLDFGPFGSFAADAQFMPAGTSQPDLPSLPVPLRARIEWLSVACKSYTTTGGRPIVTLSPSDLLKHLETLRVSPTLLSHWRAIDTELRALGIRGRQ